MKWLRWVLAALLVAWLFVPGPFLIPALGWPWWGIVDFVGAALLTLATLIAFYAAEVWPS